MNVSIMCKIDESDSIKVPSNFYSVMLSDKNNFNYGFWKIGSKFNPDLIRLPNFFSEEALDLLYISLFVFYADKIVKREIFPDAWTRNITLYIPVLTHEKWENQKELLEELLSFLSGDNWVIHFRQRNFTEKEENFKSKQKSDKKDKLISNIFCMLSGGLDSFIGAIDLLENNIENNNKIIFVNHYGKGRSGSTHINLVKNKLIDKYTEKTLKIFKFESNVVGGKENTTRTRSFMFFSHAITLASTMQNNVDLYIPENGFISLNIPLINSRLGSNSTRTTHPYYMKLLQKLLTNLNILVTLKNPYQFKTKGEMICNCNNKSFLEENLDQTMSCSHPDAGRYNKSITKSTHCGICFPCLIRRAAIKKAGLQDKSGYEYSKSTSGITAKKNLGVYRLSIWKYKKMSTEINYQIQLAGHIEDNIKDYINLYKRGMDEIADFFEELDND